MDQLLIDEDASFNELGGDDEEWETEVRREARSGRAKRIRPQIARRPAPAPLPTKPRGRRIRRPPPRPPRWVRPGRPRRRIIVHAGAPRVCPVQGSEYVRWVQSRLNRLEGERLLVNGIMNRDTRAAVRRFQQRHGLPANGIAGPDTKHALLDDGSAGTSSDAYKPANEAGDFEAFLEDEFEVDLNGAYSGQAFSNHTMQREPKGKVSCACSFVPPGPGNYSTPNRKGHRWFQPAYKIYPSNPTHLARDVREQMIAGRAGSERGVPTASDILHAIRNHPCNKSRFADENKRMFMPRFSSDICDRDQRNSRYGLIYIPFRFEARTKPRPYRARPTYDRRTTLEAEVLFGGISEKDYLRWAQFSLNLYFQKTRLRSPIVENGKDTTSFRDAIELFNTNATGRKNYRELDRKTQDYLIRENERNKAYLNWLRKHLSDLGYDHLLMAYSTNEKPTWAIKEFQGDYDGKFGLTLVRDGFVGAKTHVALLHAIKRLKPRPPFPTWHIDEEEAEEIKSRYGQKVLDWAKLPPTGIEAKEFKPPRYLRANYKTIFVWKSKTPHKHCLVNPRPRLQILLMLRDDKAYWEKRTGGEIRKSTILQTVASTAIRDYRQLIIQKNLCPRAAYLKLSKIGKDVIYTSFIGLFRILSPKGVPNMYPAETKAFAHMLEKIITRKRR